MSEENGDGQSTLPNVGKTRVSLKGLVAMVSWLLHGFANMQAEEAAGWKYLALHWLRPKTRFQSYLPGLRNFNIDALMRNSVRYVMVLIFMISNVSFAQPAIADKADEAEEAKAMGQVLQFHVDWRRERRPLTSLRLDTKYFRSLVVDDLVNRIAEQKLADVQKEGNESIASRSLSEEIMQQAQKMRGDAEFPIELSPNEDPKIGHVDCALDYQCSCSPEHSYIPIKVNDISITHPLRNGQPVTGIVKELERVADGQIYSCYEMANHHEGFQKQTQCRFLSHLSSNKSDHVFNRIVASKELAAFSRGSIAKIVVESSVRASNKKHWPLDRASKHVRPVYMVANDELYIFDELYHDPEIRCALVKVFRQPLFDVSGCKKKSDCASRAMSEFLRVFDESMKSGPIQAALDLSDVLAPGERIYLRNYEASNVLGAPYFESSQYVVKWYRNDVGRISPPGMYTYSGGNAEHVGNYVFLDVRQSLSARPGRNGSYPEGTREQYAMYQKAVADTVSTSLSKVCQVLSGVLNGDSLCVIKER